MLGFSSSLRLLSPETAHTVGKKLMQLHIGAPGRHISTRRYRLFDQLVDNVVGLAAGFDKNAELVRHARFYGFGWVEVGSVTWGGGPGNPKPRLFRLPGGHLLNRMGLNGDPATEIETRLTGVADRFFAVNIAKTNNPGLTGTAAIEDISNTYRLLCRRGLYTAINISCPNTKSGDTFEDPAALTDLLQSLNDMSMPRDRKPLVVKFSPSSSWIVSSSLVARDQLLKLAQICVDNGVAGFISANTHPIGAYAASSRRTIKFVGGGLSGPDLLRLNLDQIKLLASTGKTVIACGGISTDVDARKCLDVGATAIQAYTGFVRGPWAGPRFAYRIANSIDTFTSHEKKKDEVMV